MVQYRNWGLVGKTVQDQLDILDSGLSDRQVERAVDREDLKLVGKDLMEAAGTIVGHCILVDMELDEVVADNC